jgi:CBS domain containing-hemolysin-like protein
MSPAVGIALTVALLALSAFFVAAEFALVAARRSAIEPAAERGSRQGLATLRAMERLSLMLAGAQLGVTVCSVALGAVSEPALAHLIEPAAEALGLPASAVHPVAFSLALLLVTGLHVVFGEMVPKNATLAGPERAVLWLAPALAAIVRVFRPLIWALNAATNLMLHALRVTPRSEVASTVTREELAGVVAESHREGLLDADDHDLLSNAIGFGTTTAGDLMLPLTRVHTIAPQPTTEVVERLAATTGVTRFPVRDDRRTPELTGYIHLRDVLATDPADRARPLPDKVVRYLPTVPADLPLQETCELLRARRSHIARVCAPGAASRTVGVITLDDILESLTSQ